MKLNLGNPVTLLDDPRNNMYGLEQALRHATRASLHYTLGDELITFIGSLDTSSRSIRVILRAFIRTDMLPVFRLSALEKELISARTRQRN